MIPAPPTTANSELADWVELSCLKGRNVRLSRSDTIDQLSDYGIANAQDLCSSVWLELDRRERALGDRYPLEIAATGVQRRGRWQDHLLYTTLALISSARHFRETQITDFGKIAKLFEKTVAVAVARYIGGRAIRVGHPREAPAPKSFVKLLAYLATELGEGLRRANPLIAETKDCRADVIAWRPFLDARNCQLVLFTQCAIGANWTTKLTECDVKLWERYIEFVVTPTRAFAIPHIEPDQNAWLEYGTLGGIAFDRLRVVEMVPHASIPRELRRELAQWSRAQLARVPWDA